MISAQNHLRQLNGNNVTAFAMIILILFLSSCRTKKKLVTRAEAPPIKKEEPVKVDRDSNVSGKMDTIQWIEIDRTIPIETGILTDLDMEKKDRYTIDLLLPLGLERKPLDDVLEKGTDINRLTQFYAGLKMALSVLEEEGVDLLVNVKDIESGSFDAKLRACRSSDLIIGPRNRDQLVNTANFGKVNEIPVVSPWLSSSRIARDNPYYIQLKPGLLDHYNAIVRHVKEHFSNDQVFLLGRDKTSDRNRIDYFQNLASAYDGEEGHRPFNEYYVDEDSLRIGETAFDSIFLQGQTTVFILPNWSFSEDESFVYSCVRKLSGEKGLENVILYGMPILYESEKIGFEYYSILNMRICRSYYVDKKDPIVEAFRRAYFEKYNDFPTEDACQGYDMMYFLGQSLYKYGRKFQYFLSRSSEGLLQATYDIQKVFPDDASLDRFEDINYFQNKHIEILNFENYRFKREAY